MVALTVLCPLAGYELYKPLAVSTTTDRLIANPAMTGAIAGAVLFSLFTLLVFDRVRKNRTEALMHSMVAPITLFIVKLVSISLVAFVSVSIAAVFYYPYTVLQMGNIFDSSTYLSSFYILMLGSILLAVFAATALYQIFYRVDISFATFIAFMLISFSQWVSDDYIIRWVNPIVPLQSDDFSNRMGFSLMLYNRLFWFLILSGVWLFSVLCVRCYGKSLLGSFAHNVRKAYVPLLAVVLISCGRYVYVNQPYIDHSPAKVLNIKSNPNKKLFLFTTDLDISFDTKRGTLRGKAVYLLQNTSGEVQKCRMDINPGYTISYMMANGRECAFRDLKNDTNRVKNIVFTLPKNRKIKLIVGYGGAPKIWSIFRDTLLSPTNIDGKYIDLRSTTISPSLEILDSTMGAKINGRFTMPQGLTPITTGDSIKLISKNKNGTKTWFAHNDGNDFCLIAGDYVKKKFIAGGMPVEFYYSRKHEEEMKKLRADKVMQYTINYNISHYGKLAYVTEKRPVKIIQGSVLYSGGGARDNFSIMGENYFSDEGLNDKQEGASKAEVLAHEITHQWWNSQFMDPKNGAWTTEGVTVYTTYRMMKEKYGSDYAKKNYVDQWKKAYREQKYSFYNRCHKYLTILPERYTTMLQMSNDGTDMYNTIPLKIYKAAKLVGGEDKMDKLLSKLYQKTITGEMPYITYGDFLKVCRLSEGDLELD